ncbi:hypothetical protein EVAR_38598_1 [Eumeta japonica]|uniref:Uncharacterized protein n=1 Tax=Eumeta variegata TaxID=151549 RepID=A0A4C1WQ51_EUMVA|nr:hypothetical protein EVAR_38598_1 [Eumeta japonica]
MRGSFQFAAAVTTELAQIGKNSDLSLLGTFSAKLLGNNLTKPSTSREVPNALGLSGRQFLLGDTGKGHNVRWTRASTKLIRRTRLVSDNPHR